MVVPDAKNMAIEMARCFRKISSCVTFAVFSLHTSLVEFVYIYWMLCTYININTFSSLLGSFGQNLVRFELRRMAVVLRRVFDCLLSTPRGCSACVRGRHLNGSVGTERECF